MRAPGHPQASFAMESVLDELAYGINMDPVEFRKKNLADPVYHRQLDRVAKEIGWLEHPHRTQPGVPENALAVGIGFGVAIWGSRSRDITVVDVRIGPDGSVLAATGVQDIGQGARTLVAAIVAEELGLAAHEVSTDIGDSRLPPSVASGGSVTTGSLGPSVKDGALQCACRTRETDRADARCGAGGDSVCRSPRFRGRGFWPIGELEAGLRVLGERSLASVGAFPASLA